MHNVNSVNIGVFRVFFFWFLFFIIQSALIFSFKNIIFRRVHEISLDYQKDIQKERCHFPPPHTHLGIMFLIQDPDNQMSFTCYL